MTEKFGSRMEDKKRTKLFLDEMENMCSHSDSTVLRFTKTFGNSTSQEKKEMLDRLGYYICYREGFSFPDACNEIVKRFEELDCMSSNTVRAYISDLFKNHYASEKRIGKTKDKSRRKNFSEQYSRDELLYLVMRYRYPEGENGKNRTYYQIYQNMKEDGVLPKSWTSPSSLNKFMLRLQATGVLKENWKSKSSVKNYFEMMSKSKEKMVTAV